MATIDGSIQLVKVVTDAELRQNGGSFVVAGRMAQPIQGFDTLTKRAGGGNAIPVYVVSDAQIADGTFRLKGGSASPMADIDVVAAGVKTIQGAAIPVYVVSGSLGAGGAAVPDYAQVLVDDFAADEVWQLVDIDTGVVIQASVNGNRDGVLNTWVLQNAAGPVANSLAPFLDGPSTGSQTGIGTVLTSNGVDGIVDIFDGATGSIFLWAKVGAAGNWTDAALRRVFSLQVDGGNYVILRKSSTANTFDLLYNAGGTSRAVSTTLSTTDWFSVGLSWDKTAGANGELKAYINGVQVGTTQTGLGTWVGNLTAAMIATSQYPSNNERWIGWLAYFGVKFGATWSAADFLAMHNAASEYTYTPLALPSNVIANSSIFEWFQKPAARMAGDGNSYVGYVNTDGEIGARKHNGTAWETAVVVDDLTDVSAVQAIDDHNAPQVYIRQDGKIQFYYAVHDTVMSMFVKTSTSAGDISSFGTRTSLADSGFGNAVLNYPQVKRIASGNLLLFYRRGIFADGEEFYRVSADDGTTYGAATRLIKASTGGAYGLFVNNGDQIHCVWNRSRSTPAPLRYNMYYFYSDDGGATWKKRDGTAITLPADESNCDLVFDSLTGGDDAYAWDIRLDGSNAPRIVFAHKQNPNHEYRYAWHNGTSWQTRQITTSTLLYNGTHFYSGGIVIDPNDVNSVFLTKPNANGYLEVERWSTADSGETWAMAEQITTGSKRDNFRLQVIEGDASSRLVWCYGIYDGLIANEWTGYHRVHVRSSR